MATMATQAPGRTFERRNLVKHFFEMVLSMFAGMFVLGALAQMVCAVTGHGDFLADHAGVRALVMTINMVAGMSVWMLYRGRSTAAIAEMGAAMFVPLGVLILPFWVGALSGEALLVLMHVLMVPCMIVAIEHRRGEYAVSHIEARRLETA